MEVGGNKTLVDIWPDMWLVLIQGNFSRTPVAKLGFGPKSGQLVISQLLTAGRLLPDYAEDGPGVYGRRYDPVAVQFVLNMIEAAMAPQIEAETR